MENDLKGHEEKIEEQRKTIETLEKEVEKGKNDKYEVSAILQKEYSLNNLIKVVLNCFSASECS